MKYTSAAANKRLRKLSEEKEYYLSREENSKTYVVAVDEQPVIPEFDYASNAAEIDKIDCETVRLKHAINLNNALARIDVDGKIMSVDEILIRLAQLNRRFCALDEMRKALPKSRVAVTSVRTTKPEYRYINYDLELVKADFEKVSDEIARMQLALDRYNQTYEFDVEE